MTKTAPAFTSAASGTTPFSSPQTSLSTQELSQLLQDWHYQDQYSLHSLRTIEFRRHVGEKLVWFLEQQNRSHCETTDLRRFLAYAVEGHRDPEGRWGNARMTKPLRPATLHRYYRELRAFFNWVVKDERLKESPMTKVAPPQLRSKQVQPFTQAQQTILLSVSRTSNHPRRDEAILLFLLDTGVRASELCGLKMRDLDLQQRRCSVVGKGNKRRSIFFGRSASKALWQYLREQPRDENDYVFTSDRGTRAAEPLTRSGLFQLVQRLGQAAQLQAARCSPHTFRHTFAVEFLRNGGNVFSLQQILGHTSLHMTNRYVALAQADIENQHRQFSPADRLKGYKV